MLPRCQRRAILLWIAQVVFERVVATAFCIVVNPWSLRHPLDRGRENSLVNPLSMTFFALKFEVIES